MRSRACRTHSRKAQEGSDNGELSKCKIVCDTELSRFATLYGLGFQTEGDDQEACVFIKSTKMDVDWHSVEVIPESTFCPDPAIVERLHEFCGMLGVPQEKEPGVFVIVTFC